MEKHFHKDEFGICPICGKQLYLYVSNKQMFKLNTGGAIVNEQCNMENIKFVCRCGYNVTAKKTIEGIRPLEYANRIDNISIDTVNPIGRITDD